MAARTSRTSTLRLPEFDRTIYDRGVPTEQQRATRLDESVYGRRAANGEWTPTRRASYGPLFDRPTKPLAIVRWFFAPPGYLLPWNAFYALVAVLVWRFATPSPASMRSLSVGPILAILARNLALTVSWFGGFHLLLYMRRIQGTATKYNGRWPRESNRFLFGSQTRENVFWTLTSGVSVWTAYEVLTLWLGANGRLPFSPWATHPVWFAVVLVLTPLWRELHFYAVHRLIHARALYERVHALHHRNTNPGPWSGLSMHPVEHLLYFTCVLVHWVVPSHPLHALYSLVHAGLSPAPGHLGFERIAVGSGSRSSSASGSGVRTIDPGGWNHYLHHKYFEVNYADGAIPFDRWFGSFHDGSPEAHQAMKARLAARRRAAPTD
jgi:sterol desaturase/sphingolipid hydroxylase (fatty acid hydroxylase superfamily)